MDYVLITGGGGPAGLNTARALARAGVPVVITVRRMNDKYERFLEGFRDSVVIEPVNLVRHAEVFDLFSRYQFRGVIHAAAAHMEAQTRAANHANYDMIFNCLEAAEMTGVSRFILVSSIMVYAGLTPPFSEDKRIPVMATVDDSPDALLTHVGPDGKREFTLPSFEAALKRCLEQIALDYAIPMRLGSSAKKSPGQKFKEHKLDVAVLRLCVQFGPGYVQMGSPLARAVHTLAGKGNLMTGTGYGGAPLLPLWNTLAALPLVYVRDTASALFAMMQAETLPHRVYNVSSGFTTSAREQLRALDRIKPNAADLLKIDPKALQDMPNSTSSFNAELLIKDLGWSSGYSLEGALEDYARWLRDHPY